MRRPGQNVTIALLAAGLLTALIGVPPASAGTTSASSPITTAGRGATMPEVPVTVADAFGTMDGALFRISDGWRIDPADLRPTPVPWAGPGTCGIASLVDGNGQTITDTQTVDCFLKLTVAGFYNLRFEATTASVPSPITVTFAAGFLTAPTIGTSSTWTVASVNNTDGSTPTSLVFDLADLAVTPEAQSISCEQGVPFESAPLATTGFTGTVTYDLLDDPPNGLVIDPVTGVISGTPIEPVTPGTIRIEATAPATGGSATATVELTAATPPTSATTAPTTPTTVAASGDPIARTGRNLVPTAIGGALLVMVGASLLVATRRSPARR